MNFLNSSPLVIYYYNYYKKELVAYIVLW